MIKPTIGRVVWVQNRPSAIGNQAEAAFITYVHSDTCINVGGFNANGTPFGETSVLLVQDDQIKPRRVVYAKWMPYQKGQAAKTEALETAVAARTAGPTTY